MRRNGLLYTLEAILGGIILLSFIAFLGPQVSGGTDTGSSVNERVYNVLASMDANNTLREPVMDRNLTPVRDEVAGELPGRQVEVAGLFVNATVGQWNLSGSKTQTFSVDKAASQREVLKLWFENASDPAIEIRDRTVANLSGAVDGYRAYRIEEFTSDGSNTLNISVSDWSGIDYVIDIYEEELTGDIPEGAEVTVTSYPLSGWNQSANPAEVTVLSWR